MSMTAELQAAERRLAAMVNRRADAEEAQARAEAAERMMAERQRAREDAERRREYQVRYADAFAAFGSLPPAPVEDERPGEYRARLFEHLRRRWLWCKHWKSSQAGVLGLDVDHAASTAYQISGAVLFLMRSLPSLN